VTGLGVGGCRPPRTAQRDAGVTANARFVEADLTGAGVEGAWTRERLTSCCWIRQGRAPPSCSSPWRIAARRIVTCPAIPGRWRGMRACSCASTATGCQRGSHGHVSHQPRGVHGAVRALLNSWIPAPELVISLTRQTLQLPRAGRVREFPVSPRYGPGERSGACNPAGHACHPAKIGQGLPPGAVLRAGGRPARCSRRHCTGPSRVATGSSPDPLARAWARRNWLGDVIYAPLHSRHS
jgi:hypothetical protein